MKLKWMNYLNPVNYLMRFLVINDIPDKRYLSMFVEPTHTGSGTPEIKKKKPYNLQNQIKLKINLDEGLNSV
jgi:hypothetical protein